MKLHLSLPQSKFSRRIFVGILLVLTLFAALFVLFQQSREKKYKIELLNSELQDYNQYLNKSLETRGSLTQSWLDTYLQAHPKENLRLTIVSKNGTVLYDNLSIDESKLSSHSNRKEIVLAIKHGTGYDINRTSQTLGEDYFYSASYFPEHGYVIRTALPYNMQLIDQLQTDHLYLWFALVLLVVLIFMVWRFCMHLDQHIISLRTFADKAENDKPLDTPDLMSFNDDELGEVAERIIVMYRRLKETRQEQDRLKRELTQNVAHELKTPVASIQGYLDTILSQPDMDEQTKTAFLQQSFSQVTRLTSLIRDILVLNRLDESASSAIEEMVVVDMKQVIAQVVADTEQALKRQNMSWDIKLPSEEVHVMGTEKMVYSIFRNLTDNAIAYAGLGSTISLAISRNDISRNDFISGSDSVFRSGNLSRSESNWAITFADNGIGVPPEHLPRLFERFYRVDKGRSREIGGTGLGLSIVRNTVLAMQGQIIVGNGLEGGLAFSIIIPANPRQTNRED